MEKNFISEVENTHFYINLATRTYGVCINIKDLDKVNEILQYFKESTRQTIKAWQHEWKEGVA